MHSKPKLMSTDEEWNVSFILSTISETIHFILKIVLSTKKFVRLANKTKSKSIHYTVGVLWQFGLDPRARVHQLISISTQKSSVVSIISRNYLHKTTADEVPTAEGKAPGFRQT